MASVRKPFDAACEEVVGEARLGDEHYWDWGLDCKTPAKFENSTWPHVTTPRHFFVQVIFRLSHCLLTGYPLAFSV